MNKNDLLFDFPESLIAQEPLRPSRICSALLNAEGNLSSDSKKNYQQMRSPKTIEEPAGGADGGSSCGGR